MSAHGKSRAALTQLRATLCLPSALLHTALHTRCTVVHALYPLPLMQLLKVAVLALVLAACLTAGTNSGGTRTAMHSATLWFMLVYNCSRGIDQRLLSLYSDHRR